MNSPEWARSPSLDALLAWYMPSALAFAGMAVTCAGVALAVWKNPRLAPAAID